jgi:hypothetical protein
MFLGQLHQKIQEVFGFSGYALVAGNWYPIKNDAGTEIGNFQLWSYWIAEIRGFETLVDGLRMRLIEHHGSLEGLNVAVLNTSNGLRGILLIPPIREPRDRDYGGPYPLYPLELTNWEDPVAAALKSVKVFPDNPPNGIFLPPGSNSYGFNLEFGIGDVCYGEFHCEGPMGDNSFNLLFQALLSVTRHFLDLYDDDEMREFIKIYDTDF